MRLNYDEFGARVSDRCQRSGTFTSMHELDEFLTRPNAAVADDVANSLGGGPIDPHTQLSVDEPARLLDPGYLDVENGFCTNRDGSGFVAVLTQMPGVTAEMIDWWFDWHPHDPMRYRIWFPAEHFDISFEPAVNPGAKPFQNTIHRPIEDVGLGKSRIRIEFVEPEAFGFPSGDFPGSVCSTIICGYAGDDKLKVRHTRMCHIVRDVAGGVELRSRFWIGTPMSLYSNSPIARPVNRILNTKFVRSRAVPARAPKALAHHCAQEYVNLAAILPELWNRYGAKTES
ncbi:MAG: hypothetical protein Q7R41_00650 [Phycisphaerales bacterium]|nr:hypothetical protein [Phycisphaerales bacterium]